jgi:hypothetical protein
MSFSDQHLSQHAASAFTCEFAQRIVDGLGLTERTVVSRHGVSLLSRMGWTGRTSALSGRALKHEEHAAMSQKTNAVAVRTIGIDTGKNTFHLIGLGQRGTILLREKLARGRIGGRLANASPCLIGIEAGMATHYVARELLALGHDVRQVPPTYAKPFRQGHKNDFRDAYAIAEAVLRPSTRCVPVKTDDQWDLQALHRVRSCPVGQRTAVTIKSVASSWSAALQSAKDLAVCASSSQRF